MPCATGFGDLVLMRREQAGLAGPAARQQGRDTALCALGPPGQPPGAARGEQVLGVAELLAGGCEPGELGDQAALAGARLAVHDREPSGRFRCAE